VGGVCHLTTNLHAILAHARVHINVSERQWMTKRYPLRSTLGGRDARNSRGFQRIALWILKLANRGEDARRHSHEGVCYRRTVGNGFLRDVNHARFAAFVVMRESGHWIARWVSRSAARERERARRPLVSRDVATHPKD